MKLFLSIEIPEEEWKDEGLDLSATSARISRMYREELLSGYRAGAYDELCSRLTCFPSDGNDSMVFCGNIKFWSLCSHHVIPFSGEAFVAYVPREKIVGASKLARVVEHYSRMLQIQERLSRQVADFLFEKLEARFVVVLIKAVHLCMTCRGVKQQDSNLITTAIRPHPGYEDDPMLRPVLNEFYAQLNLVK